MIHLLINLRTFLWKSIAMLSHCSSSIIWSIYNLMKFITSWFSNTYQTQDFLISRAIQIIAALLIDCKWGLSSLSHIKNTIWNYLQGATLKPMSSDGFRSVWTRGRLVARPIFWAHRSSLSSSSSTRLSSGLISIGPKRRSNEFGSDAW